MDEITLNETDRNSSLSSDDLEKDNQPDEIDPVLYVAVLAIIVIFGVVGNCLTIVLFSTKQHRRQSFAVYLRALAVSDSLVLVFTLVDDVITRLIDDRLLYGNRSLCPVVLLYSNFLPVLSSLLLISVAVDRYVAVGFPLSRSRLCTFRRAIYTVFGLIVLGICFSLSEIIWVEIYSSQRWSFYYSEYFSCPELNTFEYNLFYSIYSFCAVLFLPFSIVFILNVRVLWVVKSSLGVKVSAKTTGSQRISMARVTIPVVTVTVSSVLLLLPLMIVEMVEFVSQWVALTPEMQGHIDKAWAITNIIKQLNYAMNFYIFAVSTKNHRQHLKQIFGFRNAQPSEAGLSVSGRVSTDFSNVNSTDHM